MPTLNYSRVTGAGNGWTRVETPDGRSLTVKGDRAMRNNNPGNIEYGKFAKSYGAIGTDGRFAVFPSREKGIKAQSGLLFGKNYKDLTLAEAISKYAPEFENNTAAYAATVAAMSGVPLDTKMSDIPLSQRNAVVEAMHYVEGNTIARAYDETGALAYTLDGKPSRLPDTMTAPQTLAEVQAREQAQQIATAQAFRDPFRALDVVPSRLSIPDRPATPTPMMALNSVSPPSRFAPVPSGTITRSALPSIPASLTPAPVGRVERAPLGPVGQFTAPAQSLAHPVSSPKPTNLAAAPVSPVTKGPALAPATPNASTLAAQYSQYRPSTVTSMPTVAGMPSIPAPTGLPAAKPVATPLQHPVSVPSQVVAPAPVLAPALAPPKEVKDYNVADIAAAPAPRATAYDVYNGLADTALDNTGQNTVGRLPDGTTTVTNKYGVTTGMTPYGKQTAVGSMPSLPGISGPVGKALPGVAGSMLGGYFGGPVGAIAGGLLAKAITGGLLGGNIGVGKSIGDGLVSYAAPGLGGTIVAASPQRGGGFPSAPSGGYGNGGRMGASFSNRSKGEMDSISPGASKAIGAGKGGLY